MRRLLTPSTVAVVVLGTAAVVLWVIVLLTPDAAPLYPASQPRSPAVRSDVVPAAAQSVVFMGDGYTSGSSNGGEGAANYTAILAGRQRWQVTNTAVYGSGYVAGPSLADQITRAVEVRPRLVVVSGGRADLENDPDTVRDAAGRLYVDLKTQLPQATIVVIGPMWTENDVPLQISAIRDVIRESATAAGLTFVDPLDERWFIGADEEGIVQGGGDLNDRGQQRLSELVGNALREANAVPQ